jgi:hypothetical protein
MTPQQQYSMHRPFRINNTMNNQQEMMELVQRNHQQPARRYRRRRRRRCPSDRSSMRTILLLTVQVTSTLLSTTNAQFCRSVSPIPLQPATWAQFETAVQESYGLAILCPFESSGDRCGGDNDADREGLVVESNLYLFCDTKLQGLGCTINCPGRHVTARPTGQLTLHGFLFSGATESSIQVESNGYVRVINSAFQE